MDCRRVGRFVFRVVFATLWCSSILTCKSGRATLERGIPMLEGRFVRIVGDIDTAELGDNASITCVRFGSAHRNHGPVNWYEIGVYGPRDHMCTSEGRFHVDGDRIRLDDDS